MKINREYFNSDRFYATVLVSIAAIAILSLVLFRDSVQLMQSARSSRHIVPTETKPYIPTPPEAYKPSQTRLKAVNKLANEQTLKEEK